ncbi:uncharacterized protein LOC135376198 [Ornithodoros turicata]|uniref:uncharacterized protein LOC135376198 n=1 Tax=Ornithodoros turicata TaxID=34597 RepID=UPI003139EFE7
MERLKVKRGARRGQSTKIINEATAALADTGTTAHTYESLLERLLTTSREIGQLDTELEALVATESLAEEYAMVLEYEDRIAHTTALLKAKIAELTEGDRRPPAASAVTEEGTRGRSKRIKLPKLQLQTFRGDLDRWLPFWEQFCEAVHENDDLTKSEKFQYLRTLLSGPPAAAIAGLQASEACYEDAVKILTSRFGDRKRITQDHLAKLRTLPAVTSPSDVRGRLYDHTQAHIRGLRALGVANSAYAALLVDILLKALPSDITLEYYRRSARATTATAVQQDSASGDGQREVQHDTSYTEKELERVLDFLRIEVESREKSGMVSTNRDGPPRGGTLGKSLRKEKNVPAAAVLQSLAKATSKCIFCDSEDHSSGDCNTPIELERKKKVLATDGRCFRCTVKGHRAKDCRRKVTCLTCKGKHVTSMCDPKWSGSSSTKAKEVDTVAMHAASSDRDRVSATVLLQTFRSWVIADNQSAYIRGIFDGGSQKTFVREDVSRQLELPVLDEVTVRLNTFGDPETSVSPHRRRLVQVRLRSQYDQKEHLIEAVEIPFICKDLAEATANDSFVDAIRREGGFIADEMFFPGAKAEAGICLLIGADQMWRFLKSDVRRSGADDRTVAVNTQLGWTFQGPTAVLSSVTRDVTLTCALHVEASNEERPFDLRMFWELEGLGITDGANDQRSEDDAVWLHFQDTIQKEDGRYKVSLPWKTGSATLRDNQEVAERRLRSLMKRLRSNKTLLLEYDCAMRKYLNDGHAEVVTEAEQAPTEHIYYMPHQAVVRENSTTTKLRVVFDASSHAPGTASLNAHLEKGPKQNTELLPLLLRFRTVKVALVADIAKAFLQIVVREEDRDALRFLWCNETPKEDGQLPNVEVWRMTRVPFGTTSSPFLLSATIRYHLENVEEHLQETAAHLANSFYVDDLLTGASSEDEAEQLYKDANTVMRAAGMELRKWASNSPVLNRLFADHEPRLEEHYAATIETGLLGLRWNRHTDSIKLAECSPPNTTSAGNTKRSVLQLSASIFDPLGVASPFTIRARMLFQRI